MVVVDNKIYVLGGFSAGTSSSTDALFYVDLTRDFDAYNSLLKDNITVDL